MAADRSAGNTLTTVVNCRDLAAPGTVGQELPSRDVRATQGVAGDGPRRLAAFAAGVALAVAGVAGLHHLYRAGGGFGDWTLWSAMLLLWLSALGGGIKLAMWATRPVIDAGFEAAKQQASEAVQATVAALAMIAGALGMWWVLRGGFATWWHSISGEPGWSLMLAAGQLFVAVLAGAALFTGGKHLSGLAGQVLADAGMVGTKDTGTHHHSSQSRIESWHPALMAALIAGGAGLVVMTAWLTPKLAPAIMGANELAAIGAIAATLVWVIGSNLGWWKGLAGLYTWATDASQKAGAVAGVAAVLMFSASGLGLGWFTPATVPQAHAACPPDCGGGGGLDGPPGGGQMFQPPSQGGQQMSDYQGGMNQSPMDQNGSVSIYNTQAPSISNNGANGSSGQQGPQQGWDQPAHGTQIPDYQNATPYTQGPGKPNPDFNGGQTNPGSNAGSQGGQANQGGQQQAPQQPPSQNSGQQPPQNQPPQNNTDQQPDQQPQQSDQQKIDDLRRQMQDQQQQGTQDRQRIDDLTKQLQQNKQNQKQQQPKLPSKDKKQDDQQDRDKQSGDNDTSALLLGAASTRRRKQDDQQQPDQGQQQGPDTQALAQDGAQLGQSLPGDITNTVSDSVNLGQSAGSAAQNFGSAAQAGASLASSAQSGAVNPMDAVALVQGVSGGISDTADAVGSGASIASTWINNAGQGAQLAADANPQLKPQTEQVQQLTQAGGQVADLTGQVAGGVSQVSGMVNTASSLGASGMPDSSGASDLLSEGGSAQALSGGSGLGGRLAQAPMEPPPPTPTPPNYPEVPRTITPAPPTPTPTPTPAPEPHLVPPGGAPGPTSEPPPTTSSTPLPTPTTNPPTPPSTTETSPPPASTTPPQPAPGQWDPIDLKDVTYLKDPNVATGQEAARGYINQALDKMGITDPAARENWMNGYLTMSYRESTWNPNAINTYDSNAQASTYTVADGEGNMDSRGLVQAIPTTFAGYHQSGTSNNIYDPVASVAASMNYVMHFPAYGVSRDGSDLAQIIQQANPNKGAKGY